MEVFIQGVIAICLFGIVCAMFKQVKIAEEQTELLRDSLSLQGRHYHLYWSDCQQRKEYFRRKAKEQE